MTDLSTSREELANCLSHGAGFLAALAAAPLLVIAAASRGDAAGVIANSIFAATIVLLYMASTFYHAAPVSPLKERLRKLDHAAIYLLIAGTYTPFTLGVLSGPWGWTLFGVVWTVAVLGVVFKLTAGIRFPRLSTAIYVLMGWLAVIAARPLVLRMPVEGLILLAAGGLAYTGGVAFYASRRLRYGHFVWHLFVLAGTACHFFAVLWYAA